MGPSRMRILSRHVHPSSFAILVGSRRIHPHRLEAHPVAMQDDDKHLGYRWLARAGFDHTRAAWIMDGSVRGSSLGEEIRGGSGAGASPRNAQGSGGKASRNDASIGACECASCVCSWFLTVDTGSTARGMWRYCREGLDGLSTAIPPNYNASSRSRSALAMTETELKVIAALAMMGLKSSPNTG